MLYNTTRKSGIMNLNKSGWSFREMLIIIIILLVFLLFACFYVFRLYSNLNIENGNSKNNKVEKVQQSEEIDNNYQDLETALSDAAFEYINTLDNIENMTISYQVLKSKGYIKELKINDNNTCDGYVNVEVEEEAINLTPFIKCNNYSTEGY